MMVRLTMLAFALSIVAGPPARAKDVVSDPGPAPTWEQAVTLGEASIKANLIDPGSAQIEWPYNFVGGTLKAFMARRQSGYFTCGLVNARNRMGGYTGKSWFLILIHDGAVASLTIGGPDGIDTATVSCPSYIKQGLLPPAPGPALGPAPGLAVPPAATATAVPMPLATPIGIGFQPTALGALIVSVAEKSPAAIAGLKVGQIIETVNGVPLKGLAPDAVMQVVQVPTPIVLYGIAGVGDVRVSRTLR